MMEAKLRMLLLLLAGLLPATVTACGVVGLTVTKAAAAAKPMESTAYDLLGVRSHFMQLEGVQFAKNTQTSFSCVDARTDHLYLSTPGGDYAELADGIYIFFKQTGIKPNASSIDFIFRQFMAKVATPKRPFYFHTDETKLGSLLSAAGAAGIKPKPVVFPVVQPKSQAESKVWYSLLTKPEYQGCGHVRLMLYKYKEYGLDSPFVAEQLLKSFFKYWWPTPLGSVERSKVDFVVKRGPLAGRAVAIINNNGPACPEMTPMSLAAHGGSSLFVYHQKAVADFRGKVLAPFFADVAKNKFWGQNVNFNSAAFVRRSNELAGEQLAFTINNLPPADSVNLYAVNYKTAQGRKATDE